MEKRRRILFFAAAVCCVGAVVLAVCLNGPKRGRPSAERERPSSRVSSKAPEESSRGGDPAPSTGGPSSGEEVFWLHKSDLKPPEKGACLQAQKRALEGLDQTQRKTVQDTVREEHVRIEYLLLDHTKVLKSPAAPYWEFLERTGAITIPGEETVLNEWDKDTIVANLKKAGGLIRNDAVKSDFERMEKALDDAVGAHDLRGLFSYHEMIHDYDYWAINYPAYYPTAPAPDWAGVKVYFGTPDGPLFSAQEKDS